MEYTTLGRTELRVSVAGLGCGGFSRLGLNTGGTEASAIAIIHAALDHGVNLLDTAAPYDTEGVVGKAIKGVPRDKRGDRHQVLGASAAASAGRRNVSWPAWTTRCANSASTASMYSNCMRCRRPATTTCATSIAPALLKREGTRQIPLPRHHRDLAQRPRTPDAAARRARRHVGRGDGRVPSDEPEHARGGVPRDAATSRRHAADVRGAQHLRPPRPRGGGDEGTGGGRARCRSRWPTRRTRSAS